MGRTILIVVILMSTIYAGVVISVQKEMTKLPAVLVDNLLRKEVENVSDYAIRNAVRNAGSMVFDVDTESIIQFTQHYTNYKIGNCIIDSIAYTYINSKDNFLVKTYVRGILQGETVPYSAEMAFNYPLESIGGKPNVIYLEMEKFLLFPWLIHNNQYVPDTSGNNYTGTVHGILLTGTVPYGGAYSRMCGNYDGVNNFMEFGNDPDLDPMPLLVPDGDFSFVCFAKICKNGRSLSWGGYSPKKSNQGTLMWQASDPYDLGTVNGTHPGKTLSSKPAAAIWFDYATSKVNFQVTLRNTLPANDMYRTLTWAQPYTRFAQIWKNYWIVELFNLSHTDYAWNSFGLTYNQGTMKCYINGVLVGTPQTAPTNTGINDFRAYPGNYGLMLGRRDLRYSNVAYDSYKYFCGLLDQVGIYNRAITATEMMQWHQGVMNAVNILYIKD
jgi:hypothetical protein